MASQPQAAAELTRTESEGQYWTLLARIAFRFCFLYLGLFCLTTQIWEGMIPIPSWLGEDLPDPATFVPIHQIVLWTSKHLLGRDAPLAFTGSGDRAYDWALVFCVFSFALLGTAVWSIIDRKRENYAALYNWFHVFLRFALGSQMLIYGMFKVFPLQMPYPLLTRLVEPIGNFSPMGVLWSSIGASPGYERFVGCAEALGGVLLFLPRTATFGMLICLADTIQVFTLNMTYDVPVKILSFHLILITLALLVPEFPRIADFFFSNRTVGPSKRPELFGTPRSNRIAVLVQILLGSLLILFNGYSDWTNWRPGQPKSLLYGIWDVYQSSRDGESQPLLVTDKNQWRRVIFDRPGSIAFQRMDDTFANYNVGIDERERHIALTQRIFSLNPDGQPVTGDKSWKASFTFQRIGEDRLTLDGEMDGHSLNMQLKLLDRSKLLLVSRGFHWIQEYPFNR